MSFLALENINYSIGKNKLLKNINLNIEKGQLFSILGPSGAGKTTALRVITGAIAPDSGRVILDNNAINHVPMEKRQIVMVHQSNKLFPHLSVQDNIQFGMKMKKLSQSRIDKKTDELMDFFNMNGHLNKYPSQLSGGQQQMVALMRAVAVEPKVLLLDEPFTGLDNNLKIYIRDFILKIHKKFNTTIVMITHDKEDAFLMSDKIAFMFDGEIVLTESPENLCKKTNVSAVNNFLGDIILLDDGKIVFSDKIVSIT
ncbi:MULTISPECIES: ABC transporter ATP-binding protein [unclassified Sedimentibacter]|uniref:ABC transporter ATP-binding protein n=1 Tax=unclassified Sedimentibacter TaxID=2649220 RepID=UPI0027DF4A97|nr:ABC transporter ATP-binding protein [Sedimentibacter sp. MB35-C1]WMJ76859.1 ABC transporter ATP-binding protein [Sedimentibacter sp. MB35-C1]